MSVSYGKGDKGKATKLHAEIVRSTGHCEHCFRQPPEVQLQTAHIQSRKASATRTLLRNAYCLCAGCHRKFTDQPLTFSRWVTDTWAQEYRDDLIRLANTPTKMDWTEELARLRGISEQIKNHGLTIIEARLEEHHGRSY